MTETVPALPVPVDLGNWFPTGSRNHQELVPTTHTPPP
jgi:hypothetical protein